MPRFIESQMNLDEVLTELGRVWFRDSITLVQLDNNRRCVRNRSVVQRIKKSKQGTNCRVVLVNKNNKTKTLNNNYINVVSL